MQGRRRLVTLTAAVLLAACTAAQEPGPATPPSPPGSTAPSPHGPHPADGLQATVVQYTRDRPARVVQVKVTNTDADEALDVTVVAPRLRGFDEARAPEQTSHLEPGRRVDFPVPLGTATCPAGAPVATATTGTATAGAATTGTATASAATTGTAPPTPAAGPDASDAPGESGGRSAVLVSAATADGATVERVVPITDDAGLLRRVHTLDCNVARVERTVDISLGDTWRQVGSGADATVAGTVSMALRPGGESAQVTALEAGLLLGVATGDPEAGGDPATYTVDAQRPRTTWDVEVFGARCDGHAVAESRRLMALTFLVTVPGAEAVPIRRSPDEAGYQVMVSALLERCESRGSAEE